MSSSLGGGLRTLVVTAAVATGILLAALDYTIIGTAMPTVVAALGGLELFSWVFAAYSLVSTVAMPIFGRLADLFGRKRLYLGGLVVFVVASALCGLAQTMPQLIAARAIQGIGSAVIFPIALTIIGDLYPPERRGQVQGVIASMWAIAALVGPGLGTLVVDTLGWRWVFFVNLPVSLIPIVSLSLLLRERPRPRQPVTVDAAGALTLAASIAALLFALRATGPDGRWPSPLAFALLGASAGLLALFVWLQTRVPAPTIPLHLFRQRMFILGTVAGFAFGWLAFTPGVFVPLLTQATTGGAVVNAGAALTAMTLGWSSMSTVCGPLIRPLGYRTLNLAGFGLMGIGYFLLTRYGAGSGLADIAIAMVFVGMGCGTANTAILLAIQNSVDPRQLGVATSLSTFFRNIGSSIGISLLGAIHIGRLESWYGGPVADVTVLLASAPATGETAARLRDALVLATHDVFIVQVAVVALALAVSSQMTGWRTPMVSAPGQTATADERCPHPLPLSPGERGEGGPPWERGKG
ncbi:MAG: MFS transporter [Chloroflexi bacterium]|nr:MFS transporter [Chloroflexota bacterium]